MGTWNKFLSQDVIEERLWRNTCSYMNLFNELTEANHITAASTVCRSGMARVTSVYSEVRLILICSNIMISACHSCSTWYGTLYIFNSYMPDTSIESNQKHSY